MCEDHEYIQTAHIATHVCKRGAEEREEVRRHHVSAASGDLGDVCQKPRHRPLQPRPLLRPKSTPASDVTFLVAALVCMNLEHALYEVEAVHVDESVHIAWCLVGHIPQKRPAPFQKRDAPFIDCFRLDVLGDDGHDVLEANGAKEILVLGA